MKRIQSGDIFDKRYRLEKHIGGGGYSEVWLAQDAIADHKVALKIYAPGRGLDEDGLQIFIHEFKLAYNFNHTNLLHSSHLEVYEGMPYLLMPYCSKGSADNLMGAITEEEAWRFLHDVAAGLEYLHSQSPPVIHQDIKPKNVLIDEHGTFLITDFGISTKARSTLRKSVANVSGGGTVAYMAPERFGKDNSPIKASDVWALGATLFELLTGDTPFGDHGGLVQKSGAEIPEIKGSRSVDLKTIVERCLALETWDRPTAKQLVEWTEQHKRGEKIFEKETSPLFPLPPPPPPKPKFLLWGVIAGIAILLTLFLIGKGDNEDAKWLTDFQTGYVEAENRFAAQDYENAKSEYEQVLSLIPAGDKSDKKSVVSQKIADCDKAIKDAETARLAKEQKEKEERKHKAAQEQERDRLAREQKAKEEYERKAAQEQERDRLAREQKAKEERERKAAQEQAEVAKYDIPLVYVAGFTFTMGCTSEQGSDCRDSEKPAHQVRLSNFYIGKYEVTQAQWKAVMDNNNPSYFKGDNLPVENVSWDDIQEFISRLNRKTGKQYRLPTEAEWEYAARGGWHNNLIYKYTIRYKYSGSNTIDDVAWYGNNSRHKTHPVGTKQANKLGIYDMSGNVLEWCQDWYDIYSSDSQTNPKGPSFGSDPVARGGSWYYIANNCRVTYRDFFSPGFRDNGLGFRLACSLK